MRDNLKNIENQRTTFIGTFVRVGSKTGYQYSPSPTFILKDITDSNGNFLADHLWVNQTSGFKQLGWLNAGDRIQFNGRVKLYGKDERYDPDGVCRYHQFDYGISHPTNFKIISRTK